MEYKELHRRLKEAGLLSKQHRFYFTLIGFVMAGFALCLWIFTQSRGPVLLVLNTLAFALINVQLAFLVHDASHGALFGPRWQNDVVGFLAADLLMGVSFGWYAPLHARHHANPHHEDLDPDIAVYEAVFAISARTAARARGLKRLVIRHQGWLLPLVLPLQAFVLKDHTLRFVLLERSRRRWLELALLAVHYTLYLWFFFHFLGTGQAVAVILLQQLVVGSHLSAVFVPNHIGRPIARGEAPDWITAQVGPSRNVVTPPAMDILWGGLNHQIEHHLVPSMSRNLVRRAAPVVRQFLEEQGMVYYEASILDSYREVVLSVHRTGKAAGAAADL